VRIDKIAYYGKSAQQSIKTQERKDFMNEITNEKKKGYILENIILPESIIETVEDKDCLPD